MLGIFLDLSEAKLDHTILVTKLSYYGVGGIPLLWFASYLSERKQQIQINNVLSTNILLIRTGVPQGSILRPLLFILYDFPKCLIHSSAIMFADDRSVFFATLEFINNV